MALHAFTFAIYHKNIAEMIIIEKYKHLTVGRLNQRLEEIRTEKAERLQAKEYEHVAQLRNAENEMQQALDNRLLSTKTDDITNGELH